MMSKSKMNQQTSTDQRIQQITHTALDVVESVMMDVETPVNVRLEAAFKFFEMFDVKSTENTKVTQDFENNVVQLAPLLAALKGNNIVSSQASAAVN